MISAIADTHTAVWYLQNDPRLSATARHRLETSSGSEGPVGVSAISLVEMVYLVEKKRITLEEYETLRDYLRDDTSVLVEIPVTNEIAETMRSIVRETVPDMPDRVIAATALHLGVPLITRDEKIRASKVRTIW